MYIGSQNFNFSSGYMELMVETPFLPEVEEHVNFLFSDSRNIFPISGVIVKGTSSDPMVSKVKDTERFGHDFSFDTNSMELIESINLREIAERSPTSSLNLYHGRGRLNRETMRHIPRPWYEVELTIGSKRYPGLPKNFTAFTDDDKIIEMHRSGGDNTGNPELGLKDLTGKGRGGRSKFGEWIKGKLERAGVLEFRDVIDGTTFDAYGSNHLRFYRISGSEFFMEFLPED